MTPTLVTLLSYAIPASLIAGLTMWVGHERRIRWSIAEYFLIYLPFIMVFVHVSMLFGDINRAVVEMDLGLAGTLLIAVTGGFFGGITLLPRLWVKEEKLHRLITSTASSFLVGAMCLKMFFLMVVIANPKSLLAG
jgi:hypothetical protein